MTEQPNRYLGCDECNLNIIMTKTLRNKLKHQAIRENMTLRELVVKRLTK